MSKWSFHWELFVNYLHLTPTIIIFLLNLTFCAALTYIPYLHISLFHCRCFHEHAVQCPYHTVFHWISASLRRSFRLSRKDRHSSPEDSQSTESEESKFLVYEEVTRYQQKPSDKPRLVVLIGENQESCYQSYPYHCVFLAFGEEVIFSFLPHSFFLLFSNYLSRVSGCANQWTETKSDCWEPTSIWNSCST